MHLFRLFKKRSPRIARQTLGFLPSRKEFFTTFWFPVFDKSKALGLTDAEAEHTTGLIFEMLFGVGHLDATLSLKEQMLQLIRVAAGCALERRKMRSPITPPLTGDYYLPSLIHGRLVKRIEKFWKGELDHLRLQA